MAGQLEMQRRERKGVRIVVARGAAHCQTGMLACTYLGMWLHATDALYSSMASSKGCLASSEPTISGSRLVVSREGERRQAERQRSERRLAERRLAERRRAERRRVSLRTLLPAHAHPHHPCAKAQAPR